MKMDEHLSPEEKGISQVAANIVDVPIEKFLHTNYLPYAYYVIRNRALVGADGMKPVQRRILYSMYLNDIGPKKGHVKAAKVAANTMGDFHPHGNVSIEDALARMAQKFSLRVPLIDPYGSVGYFAGDRAAAARYWSARLTAPAMELLDELKDNALPLSLNYDESKDEPVVLPVRWPAVLVNGTEGIAVGFASKSFPHNPTEVMDAAIELVKNPELTIDELMKIMPGPDFPTGGELVGADVLRDCYLEGRGSFIVRGRYNVSQLSRGRSRITFYELPYQVPASSIIKEVRKLQKQKGELTEISEMKELSDNTKGLQLVFTLKSGSNPEVVVDKLFKSTSASKSFAMNETVLDHGTPSQLSIFEIFQQFLELRTTCIINSTVNHLAKTEKEIENNTGLIKVLFDLDKTLEIIKNSDTDKDARDGLIKEFGINENQAEYILSLRLRRLTRSDRTKLHDKNEELLKEQEASNRILEDKEYFNEVLIAQLEKTKGIIADKRRTVINSKTSEQLKEEEKNAKMQETALSKNSPYVFTFYSDGSVSKYLETAGAAELRTKVPHQYKMKATTDEQLFAVLPDGRGVKFPSTYIPFNSKVNKDEIGLDSEYIAIGKQASSKKDVGLLITTNTGKVALINGKYPTTLNEFPLVILEEGEKVVSALWVDSATQKKNLLLGSTSGLCTLFPIDALRVSNPGVKPIRGMSISDDESIVGVSIVGTEGWIVSTTKNSIKITDLSEIPTRSRGTKGLALQRQTEKTGPMTSMYGAEKELLAVTDQLGNEMFLPTANGRALAGTKFPTQGLIYGNKELETSDISNKVT